MDNKFDPTSFPPRFLPIESGKKEPGPDGGKPTPDPQPASRVLTDEDRKYNLGLVQKFLDEMLSNPEAIGTFETFKPATVAGGTSVDQVNYTQIPASILTINTKGNERIIEIFISSHDKAQGLPNHIQVSTGTAQPPLALKKTLFEKPGLLTITLTPEQKVLIQGAIDLAKEQAKQRDTVAQKRVQYTTVYNEEARKRIASFWEFME